MSDLIVDAAAIKPDKWHRELDLAAIRTLAKHDALDLVPMLFAPPRTFDADDRYNELRRERRRKK